VNRRLNLGQVLRAALAACALVGCLFPGPAPAADPPRALDKFPSLKEVRQKWDPQPLEAVRRAAENGDLTAQHYLGYYSSTGDRVPKDGAASVQWYTRASDAGYLPSFINLGVLYQLGQVVPRDLDKAVRYYRIAADGGLPQGQMNLGIAYRDGVGVARDPGEALKWFQRAADRGHAPAMVEVGSAYRHGNGVDKDLVKAAQWFKRAAALEEPLADLNLGLLYEEEGKGNEAIPVYRQAAEHGLPDALWLLHNLYENGNGVPRDQPEADRWLLKGAESGGPRSQTSLGYHHQYPGLKSKHQVGDTPASMAEAIKWYQRAADQHWPDAQYRLASCYLEGEGVELDEERGLELMRAAADQGHAKALTELTELYARGIGEPRNAEDKPLRLLERALQILQEGRSGASSGPYDQLIFRFQHGIGTARDLLTAAEWYGRAVVDGAYNHSLEDQLNYSPAKRLPNYSASSLPGHSLVQVMTPGGESPIGPFGEVLALYLNAARPNGGTNAWRIAERIVAGREVPANPARAWAWFQIAVRHGADAAAAPAKALEAKFTPADLAEARRQYDQLAKELQAVWAAIRPIVEKRAG